MLKKLLRGPRGSSLPRVIMQPQGVYDAVPGSSISLLVMTDPKQSLSERLLFQWQYSSSSDKDSWTDVEPGEKDRITGINSSTLLLSGVKESDRGSYRCQIANSTGTTLSKHATLTVVVPPQIEAQPCNVVGVVTGKQVLFSVAISCQRPRGGAEQGAGPETRERVGSRGQEDLEISWQFQRAHPAAAVAICNHAEVDKEGAGPETPHERILREHHPDLRRYLNTSSILPYLTRLSLVTPHQLEELTLPVHTNTRKVDLLLNWLPRATVDFLEKFVRCLREADDHLAHSELAEKLETAMENDAARRGSQVSQMSLTVGPMPTSPAPSLSTEGDGGDMGGWEDVREEEGKVEGVTTAQLKLLHVEQEREGKYRCRVEYKKCVVFSHSASLSVLADEEIVGRLMGECRGAEEGVADAAVEKFLVEHGNSSRLAKKALVAVLNSQSEQTSLVHSFTSRQVPVNFTHNGMCPLHYACVRRHWRTVQHLITCGASKTAITEQDGRNAVHLVSMRGDNNSLQFLIHTGGDQLINVQDNYGKTPLHLVCEAAQKITPSKLISQDMRDIKTVIQNLLINKASLRTPDENGQTPLHLAARAGHPWIVEVFLLCDITGLDDQDNDGGTGLHIAAALNWGEVVISLLERGANESLENKAHLTPLGVAECKGHQEAANILQRKPGTVQRDRKQTVYVTDKANGRPLSVHIIDDTGSEATTTSQVSRRKLRKKTSSEDHSSARRSWSSISVANSVDSATKSLSHSGLLKIFHLATAPLGASHNGHPSTVTSHT